jgi:hypothetical protein
MERAMSDRLYICRPRPIVTYLRPNQSIILLLFLGLGTSNSSSSSYSSPLPLALELATVIAFPRPNAAWVEVDPIFITDARHRQTTILSKLEHLIWETRHYSFP